MTDSQQIQTLIDKLQKALKAEQAKSKALNEQLKQAQQQAEAASLNAETESKMSKNRELQLSFMTSLAASTLHENAIDATIKRFMDQAREFLRAPTALFLAPVSQHTPHEANEATKPSEYHISLLNSHLDAHKTLLEDTSITADINTHKLKHTFEDIEFESQLVMRGEFFPPALLDASSHFMFALPIKLKHDSVGFALFLYASDNDIDINALQTMESARTLVNLAIQQKFSSLTLSQRFSELENTYQQLENTQNQLIQSEKMASLGQLAAGVAHEINNPIGFVLSNFDVLNDYTRDIKNLIDQLENLSDPESIDSLTAFWKDLKDQHDIEFILDDLVQIVSSSKGGLERVRSIVQGLKSFSHGGDTLHVISINDCLTSALKLTENHLKYDFQTHTALHATHAIKGNAGQLEQVFINMIVNAAQAMQSGGTLSIASDDVLHDGQACAVVVKIKDTGCGIAAEDINKLFTPFYTTKPVGVGTGLGLSISYAILENHQAQTTVNSVIGEGTEFVIQLPIAHEDNDDADEDNQPPGVSAAS